MKRRKNYLVGLLIIFISLVVGSLIFIPNKKISLIVIKIIVGLEVIALGLLSGLSIILSADYES